MIELKGRAGVWITGWRNEMVKLGLYTMTVLWECKLKYVLKRDQEDKIEKNERYMGHRKSFCLWLIVKKFNQI